MGSLNKNFVKINKAAENMTKVTSEKKKKKKVSFIDSTTYKMGQKFDIKYNNVT